MSVFTIIIPVYQEYNIFRIFWESLIKTIQYPTEIQIINDASPINTTVFIRQLQVDSDIIHLNVIENVQSKGYTNCLNRALKKLTGDFIVFMDSDIILVDGWQNHVISNLADDSIGGMGCVLLYPQTGGIQNCGLTYTASNGRHLFLNNKTSVLDNKKTYEVQATIFAFFATRRDIIESTGELDYSFFNGYEDIDYQLRIRSKLQKKIVVDPTLRMFHWEQSNGIFRNNNRRSNIALLWKKHGSILKTDLWNFLFEQFESLYCQNTQYVGVDLCSSRLDANTFWIEIEKRYSKCIRHIDNYFHAVHEDKNIWLSRVLPYDYFRTEYPILFLCDNFIKLLDNQYWLDFREQYCCQDIIVDLYGNVITWNQLKNKFWPGNKIR